MGIKTTGNVKEIYNGYLIEPADTIYCPKLKIINTNDCDDQLRHAETLEEAKQIIDELLED